MDELVVISGKGGTGKTSVVAALARLVSDTIFADCDVDASNLHLALETKVKGSEEFIASKQAIHLPDDCANCGICKEYCIFGAISLDENNSPIFNDVLCEGCGFCYHVCNFNAIKMQSSVTGEWMEAKTKYGPLIYAELNPGEENSGLLVTKVKNEARELAKKKKKKLLLVDGPPGIGCSAIAAVTGANLLLIVTEPTGSGKHDMNRALKLAKHFQIPAIVCINKWDLNQEVSKEITSEVEQQNSKVICKIPYQENTNNPLLKLINSKKIKILYEKIIDELKRSKI